MKTYQIVYVTGKGSFTATVRTRTARQALHQGFWQLNQGNMGNWESTISSVTLTIL